MPTKPFPVAHPPQLLADVSRCAPRVGRLPAGAPAGLAGDPPPPPGLAPAAAVRAGGLLPDDRHFVPYWRAVACLLGPLTLPALPPRPDLLGLAREIGEGGRYDLCGALADGLEDEGCADGGLLAHLRAGPHRPGCWAIDLLLGRMRAPRRRALLRLPEL